MSKFSNNPAKVVSLDRALKNTRYGTSWKMPFNGVVHDSLQDSSRACTLGVLKAETPTRSKSTTHRLPRGRFIFAAPNSRPPARAAPRTLRPASAATRAVTSRPRPSRNYLAGVEWQWAQSGNANAKSPGAIQIGKNPNANSHGVSSGVIQIHCGIFDDGAKHLRRKKR